MRLRICHTTTYEYATPVAASTQVVRLTPRSDRGQRVLEWAVRMEVLTPTSRESHPLGLAMPSAMPSLPSAPLSEYSTLPENGPNPPIPWEKPPRIVIDLPRCDGRGASPTPPKPPLHDRHPFVAVPRLIAGDDGYGNRTHLLSLVTPHVATRLVAAGVVETSPAHDGAHDHPPSLPASYWLRHTRHTSPGGEVDRFVRESGLASWHGRGERWVATRLDDLMHRVRERIDFRVGATDVLTTADEALRRGAGVCQDHAHVMIAVARSLGIPARYVSGYLWPGHDVAAQASHAWVDLHVPGVGWRSYDAANACRPTEAYVRVAVGLDYFDAPPTKGVRRGGPRHEELGVTVEIYPENLIPAASERGQVSCGARSQ